MKIGDRVRLTWQYYCCAPGASGPVTFVGTLLAREPFGDGEKFTVRRDDGATAYPHSFAIKKEEILAPA